MRPAFMTSSMSRRTTDLLASDSAALHEVSRGCVHDDGDPDQADQRADDVVAVGPEAVDAMPQASEPATKTPP